MAKTLDRASVLKVFDERIAGLSGELEATRSARAQTMKALGLDSKGTKSTLAARGSKSTRRRASAPISASGSGKRGRPLGSKNKPKTAPKEVDSDAAMEEITSPTASHTEEVTA